MPGHCIYDEKRIGRDLGKSNVCRGEGPKLRRGGLTEVDGASMKATQPKTKREGKIRNVCLPKPEIVKDFV